MGKKPTTSFRLLSMMFFIAAIGTLYIDSTYSLEIYEGLTSQGYISAFILFSIVQIIKLKAYASLTGKASICAVLVLIASLFLSCISTWIGITLASNTKDDIHERIIVIEQKYDLTSKKQADLIKSDFKKQHSLDASNLSDSLNDEFKVTLSILNKQLKAANAEYIKQKNITDLNGDSDGPKIREAQRRSTALIKEKGELLYTQSQLLKSLLQELHEKNLKQQSLALSEMQKNISEKMASEVSHLKNNAALVYSVVDMTELLHELLNKLLKPFNTSITKTMVDLIISCCIIILLEGGLLLLIQPLLNSLFILSSHSRFYSDLNKQASQAKFDAHMSDEYNKAMQDAFTNRAAPSGKGEHYGN